MISIVLVHTPTISEWIADDLFIDVEDNLYARRSKCISDDESFDFCKDDIVKNDWDFDGGSSGRHLLCDNNQKFKIINIVL
jgi:hypothetical protein